MASAHVTFFNETHTNVDFGAYCAPTDHTKKVSVAKMSDSGAKEFGHCNARVFAAWVQDNSTHLYPNNETPFTTGGLLEDGGLYKVTLTTAGITFEPMPQ